MRARQAGQTLHEVLVIVAVLAVLMALLISPKLMKPAGPQTHRRARILINQYESALLLWRSQHAPDNCPTTLDDLHAAGYVDALPVDPWGQPLVYHCPGRDGRAWEVYSKGPDRRDGTEDDVHRTAPTGK